MEGGKKKPLKLEWRGGLAESGPGSDATRVEIRGGGNDGSAKAGGKGAPVGAGNRPASAGGAVGSGGATTPWVGGVVVRREVKGRGGKPVAIVGGFAPSASTPQREAICKALKEKLACGGSLVDEGGGEIVLQVDEWPRVEAALAKLGIKAKRGGGFAS